MNEYIETQGTYGWAEIPNQNRQVGTKEDWKYDWLKVNDTVGIDAIEQLGVLDRWT